MNVRLQADGNVQVLTLNRPERRNALDEVTLKEFEDALRKVGRTGADALVITGAGKAFCGGIDVPLLATTVCEGGPDELGALIDQLNTNIALLHALPCPTVAAVRGTATGPGYALALGCDLRVVGESTRLIPGFFGLGGSADGGLSSMMVRAFGYHRALAMALMDTPLLPDRLVAEGLAESAVPDEEVLARALVLAHSVMGRSAAALPRIRNLFDAAATNPFGQQLNLERAVALTVLEDEEFKAGVTAWVQGVRR